MTLVTIGMPVRNGRRYLEPALRSIMAQSHQDWELLIMDDGSTDGSGELAAALGDPRIRVIRSEQGRGLATRMNEALELARGDFFARMDADDVAYPERLERQLAYLASRPGLDLVGAWAIVFHGSGIPRGVRTPPESHDAICRRPWDGFPMIHPTYLAATDFFRQVGYRPHFQRSQDQDFLLRAIRLGSVGNVPEFLLGYREERVRLGNVLRSRGHFLRALGDEARARRSPLLYGRGLARAAVKSVGTTLACVTGLEHRLLKQRARPLPPEVAAAWQEVWRSVAGPEEAAPS